MPDEYFSDVSATFGDRVAAARDALGLTQSQLAGRLGVRVQTLQNWEGDRSEPRANKLQMLAGILNVSIIWLLTGEGDGGVDPSSDGDQETFSLISEVRAIRLAQIQLTERLARIEKRLRSTMTEG